MSSSVATRAKKTVIKAVPNGLAGPFRSMLNFVRFLPYRGSGRFCPVCKRSAKKFGAYGVSHRRDARCIHCGVVERHRLTWLYFEKETDLLDGRFKKVLHVAPEPQFERILKDRVGEGYLTADLLDPGAMVRMDVTSIDFPDNSFDVIYCSHVLEHVNDDRQAMREFLRVLKPTGWAILSVPITEEETIEDPTITDPAERLRIFGQEDHVRSYGPDYLDRLKNAGFQVSVISPGDFLTREEIVTMGAVEEHSEQIFLCTKP